MKANEILQVLNLTKSKETTNYCSKLAALFSFLVLAKPEILGAEIVESGFTINTTGKIMLLAELDKTYKESLLSKFRDTNKGVKELNCLVSRDRQEWHKVKELLWKKRRNKDNSILEAKLAQLEAGIKANEESIEALVESESMRLQGINPGINDVRKELGLFEGQKISVKTTKGQYTFYLPINNRFYYEVMTLLNLPFEVAKVEKLKPIHQYITYPVLLENIKKAAGFISGDDLRPAMTGVCLDFSKEGLTVIGTDAHRLYYSKLLSFEGSQEPMQFIIAPESVKVLNKVKVKQDEPLHIEVFSECKAAINGIDINLVDARFPQYRAVIPEYTTFMEFDREQLIANVKKVLPYSNQAVKQVTFHLNGSIAMQTQEIDFSFECNAEMPYISKNFNDTDIAFNGSLLNSCLNSFKEKSLKMLTEGTPTKAIIITNDRDNVLLMPMMLNR